MTTRLLEKSPETPQPLQFSVQIPGNVDPATLPSLTDALQKAVSVLFLSGQTPVLERADRLAELATGLLEPRSELIEDRIHRMATLREIFAAGDWLSAEQLNTLQAKPPANKSHPASDWKRRGRIYGVSHDGREYFARYQFDALYQPLPIIREVLAVLGPVADPWVLATWFDTPNGWIVDEKGHATAPKDALDRPEELLRAAGKRQASYVA